MKESYKYNKNNNQKVINDEIRHHEEIKYQELKDYYDKEDSYEDGFHYPEDSLKGKIERSNNFNEIISIINQFAYAEQSELDNALSYGIHVLTINQQYKEAFKLLFHYEIDNDFFCINFSKLLTSIYDLSICVDELKIANKILGYDLYIKSLAHVIYWRVAEWYLDNKNFFDNDDRKNLFKIIILDFPILNFPHNFNIIKELFLSIKDIDDNLIDLFYEYIKNNISVINNLSKELLAVNAKLREKLKSKEIDDAVYNKILSLINNFDYRSSKKIDELLSEFQIPDERLKTKEFESFVINRIVNLINDLNNYSTSTEIIDELLKKFQISDEILKTKEIEDAVYNKVLSLINNFSPYTGSPKSIDNFLSRFQIPDERLKTKEIEGAVYNKVLSLINNFDLNSLKYIEELLNKFQIPDERLKTKEFESFVINRIVNLINNFNFTSLRYIEELLNKFQIPDERLKTKEIEGAVYNKVLSLINNFNFNSLKYINELLNKFQIPDERLKTKEIEDAVYNEVLSLINNFDLNSLRLIEELLSKLLFDKYFLNSLEFTKSLSKFIALNIINNTSQYSDSLFKILNKFYPNFKFDNIEFVLNALSIKFVELFSNLDLDIVKINNLKKSYIYDDLLVYLDKDNDDLKSELYKLPLSNQAVFVFNTDLSHYFSNGIYLKKLFNIVNFNPKTKDLGNNIWHTDMFNMLKYIDKSNDKQNMLKFSVEYCKESKGVFDEFLFDLAYSIYKNNLSLENKKILMELGVNNDLNLNTFFKLLNKIQENILGNDNNFSIKNKLVYAVFKLKFLLSSNFDRDNTKETWLSYQMKDEYKLPEYLTEKQVISFQEEITESVNENDVKNYLSSQEVKEAIYDNHEFIFKYSNLNMEEIIYEHKNKNQELIDLMDKQLSANDYDWENLINNEQNLDKKNILIRNRKILINSNTRKGFEIQLIELRKYGELFNQFNNDIDHNINLIIKYNNKRADAMLKSLIINDILNHTSDLMAFKTQLAIEKITDIKKYIYILQDLFKHGINEHYLNKYSDEVKVKIKKILGVYSTDDNNRIDAVYSNIKKLETGYFKSINSISVNLIPVQSLGRLTSGNIGNACYTSWVNEMVEKRVYDKVHAFLFEEEKEGVKNFKGSVLLIETEDKNTGETVFVIRANNPRESYINNMTQKTQEMFVYEMFKTFKKYIDKYELITGKKAKLAFVLDGTGSASTNRGAVNDIYKKYALGKERVLIVDNPQSRFKDYPLPEYNGDKNNLSNSIVLIN